MVKVLVTGGCGFLGSHICELFKTRGWEVVAYDNLTKFEFNRTTYNIEKIRSYNFEFLESIGVPIIIGDIRDFDTLQKAMKDCDLVAHCAAQPTMTISMENPQFDFEVNVQGTLTVLEVCRREGAAMVNCSSIHIYGTGINAELSEGLSSYSRHPARISETQPILTGILTPLHASKAAAENYVRTYADTYGLRAATFRLTGIFGPRQFGTEDHSWMSLLAIKTLLGIPIQLIGTGKQVRDSLYVKDAARAFEQWWQADSQPGTYNIGGSLKNKTSVLEYLNLLAELTGLKQTITKGGERRGDLHYFVCNTSKAAETFNWGSRTTLKEGTNLMLNWLKENLSLFGRDES